MLPEGIEVSVLTSVDVLSAVSVVTVGGFVSVNAVVLSADPVAVAMVVVWLGVVILEVEIVNAQPFVL